MIERALSCALEPSEGHTVLAHKYDCYGVARLLYELEITTDSAYVQYNGVKKVWFLQKTLSLIPYTGRSGKHSSPEHFCICTEKTQIILCTT